MLSTKKTTSAQRQRSSRLRAALAALFVAGGLAVMARDSGQADAADSWWLRVRFSVRESIQPSETDKDIVLVELDDRSVSHWKEPLFLWSPHIAAAVERVTRGGAKMVALDWVQPETANTWFPNHDKPLSDALSKAPDVVLVKQLAGDQQTWIRPTTELLYSLPESVLDEDAHLGYSDLSSRDSIIAANIPAIQSGSKLESSFAARIAARLIRQKQSPQERSTRPYSEFFSSDTWGVTSGNAPLLKVDLREDGSFLINYRNNSGKRGPEEAFEHYSLFDIAQPSSKPDTRFKDKIVLIGATFTGFNDLHYAPFLNGVSGSRAVPGVEVQANMLRTLLDSRPINEWNPLLVALASLVLAALSIVGWLRFSWIGSALVTFGVIALWAGLSLTLFITQDFALPLAVPVSCALLASLIMGGFRALGEERERRQVLGLWGRYQDPRLVEYLLEHSEARGGQGTESEVTVLFADLKNFTKTVQHLEPAEALKVLNRYLSLMTDVIRDEYGGVVDKYLGDGLMAQWGAPQPWDAPKVPAGEHHALSATRACLELQRRAAELTEEVMSGAHDDDDVTFGLRLTLHTGPVVVGWVGAERIEFTIIGDTVNVCARLQETAKALHCEFLISESTYQHIAEHVNTGQKAEVVIRGRDRPLSVLEITGESSPDKKN